MKCPVCGYPESRVVDSRPVDEGSSIRRRRECLSCAHRFTTFEVTEALRIVVIKKDGSKELFDRSKLLGGLLKATQKRPVDAEQIAKEIETELYNSLREEITTEEERETARQQRDKLGKHVIPAPALQLKHNFAGYFMDPLRLLRGKDQGAAAERTVVRPTYSYMGEYYVSEHVMDDIVRCVAAAMPAIGRVVYVSHGALPEAYDLLVVIRMRGGYPLWETAGVFQTAVKDAVELMTAFNVVRVDVEVRDLEH